MRITQINNAAEVLPKKKELPQLSELRIYPRIYGHAEGYNQCRDELDKVIIEINVERLAQAIMYTASGIDEDATTAEVWIMFLEQAKDIAKNLSFLRLTKE